MTLGRQAVREPVFRTGRYYQDSMQLAFPKALSRWMASSSGAAGHALKTLTRHFPSKLTTDNKSKEPAGVSVASHRRLKATANVGNSTDEYRLHEQLR